MWAMLSEFQAASRSQNPVLGLHHACQLDPIAWGNFGTWLSGVRPCAISEITLKCMGGTCGPNWAMPSKLQAATGG